MSLFYSVFLLITFFYSIGGYLIFKPPSTIQVTIGFSQPIKVDNNSYLLSLALQAQYALPTNATEVVELADGVVEGREKKFRRRRDCTTEIPYSGILMNNTSYSGILQDVHKAAELWLEERGLPGRTCLQAAICAHSQSPLDTDSGFFERLLHIFLTPSMDPNAEEDLIAAEVRGREGDQACFQYYPFCSDLYQLWTIKT